MPRKPPTAISASRRAALAALMRRRRPGDEDSLGSVHPDFAGLEPRELALAARIWRGVLQNLMLLDHWIARAGVLNPRRTAAPLLWILRMAVYQRVFLGGVPDYAIGEQSVELARAAGGEPAAKFMNAVLRKLLPALPESADAPGAVDSAAAAELPEGALRYSMPPEIWDALASGYGAAAMPAIMRAMNAEETRVWLRVNSLKSNPAGAAAALLAEGCRTEPTPFGSDVLRWGSDSAAPWVTAAWARGEITVQDPGAMLAARALAPKPGETILDACAAPGGKTGQIWELMRGEGRLFAFEISPARRKLLRDALERLYGAGHGIEVPAVADLTSAAKAGSIPPCDGVLVDAPCLALGLLRRHPEAKWDGRARGGPEIVAKQRGILDAAAGLVMRGGRLVWSTCSPTRAENEELLTAWLQEKPEFALEDPEGWLPAGWGDFVQSTGRVVRTRPDLAPIDAFSVALIRRR